MIKVDSTISPLTITSAPGAEMQQSHRLIVLIPDFEADYNLILQRVWELARTLGSHVLFLGLCKDAADEPRIHRELITLSALLQDGWVSTEAKVELGTNWLKALKANWQPGDVVACFAGQSVGLTQKPLGQILESDLHATVYVLDGFYPVEQLASFPWLSNVLVWTVSLAILVGFFWLQVRFSQLPDVLARNILISVSVLGELGLIWGWNSLFS